MTMTEDPVVMSRSDAIRMWLIGLVAVALIFGIFSVLALGLAFADGEPLYDWWAFLVFGVSLYIGVTLFIVGGNAIMNLAYRFAFRIVDIAMGTVAKLKGSK